MEYEFIKFDRIDFDDPIFESIRRDYPDHDSWRVRAMETAASRCAFAVRSDQGTYAGIALLKVGEGPDGLNKNGLKISTFKVTSYAEGQGVADLLISLVFSKAIEEQAEIVFVTVLPGHEDLTKFLELRGFRRTPQMLSRGEQLYAVDLADPERIYSDVNRLAYDLLADEYRSRSDSPGPNQESAEYLAGLLTAGLTPVHRLLELGPGAGDVLLSLTEVAETVAVEISPRMAALAAERAPKALIIIGDILALDFARHSFDAVYAGAFLHLFPHVEAAKLIRRIAYWTRPGGNVFVNTTIAEKSSESLELKSDYIHRVARFRSRWTEDQFRIVVESNGLKIIRRVTTDEQERNKLWVAFICTPDGIS
jgi:phospholipid N-methyltransferase